MFLLLFSQLIPLAFRSLSPLTPRPAELNKWVRLVAAVLLLCLSLAGVGVTAASFRKMQDANTTAILKHLPLLNAKSTVRGSIASIVLDVVCVLWDIVLLVTEIEQDHFPNERLRAAILTDPRPTIPDLEQLLVPIPSPTLHIFQQFPFLTNDDTVYSVFLLFRRPFRPALRLLKALGRLFGL
jgi:hypothetical protein